MNKAILIGTLGRDPEVRTLQTGGRVVSFSMATSETWRDKDSGERKERTEWHNVVIWNEALGKIAESYLKKGQKTYIEGQIQSREYIDKDGNTRKVTEIVIPRFGGHIELLGGKKEDEPRFVPTKEHRGDPPGRLGSLKDQLNDDIPFAPEWR
jgi:single-strand DNA-binding protein